MEKTGIGITGEYSSVFHEESQVRAVELATISFGQRFEITPLQLITAVSAIANGGTLMQPRIVKQIINTDNNAITNVDTNTIRTVISKETAQKVCEMMEYVVTDGTGKNAAVKGYYIGGKTGTAEGTYSTSSGSYDVSSVSFVAIAPYENAEISILVVLYDPQTSSSYGSTLVAPVVGNMLSEILPYLGIAADDASNQSSSNDKLIKVPDITNKTVTEASKILQNAGLKVLCNSTENSNNTLVTEQVPASNTQVYSNSTVVLYTKQNSTRTSVTVPDLTGLSLAKARNTLSNLNLNLKYVRSGNVASQDIASGSSLEEGSIITVTLN
jgi:stage V sporulation protein D (sporulation-specific penicillin-binding protein)